MRKYVLSFFFFIIILTAQAQDFPSQVWHDGKIVSIEGDTLRGQIRYSQETDIVEYIADGMRTALALTGRKLLYFEIFDKTVSRYREFYALPYALNNDYEAPILFEVIHEGRPFSLLSRERVEYRVVNNPYAIAGTYSRLELVYTYYFLDAKGGIQRFGGSKRDLEWIFKNREDKIKKFIKQKKIRTDRRGDLLKVVLYYNSLFEEKNASNN
ncbi:MAG: hypothetical protein RLO81_14245 [Fulvivirga sp.]|uniref:hypothetical protein n=1 Tax=Fulvivirga sp. TaxID=1931237 RepID=UPI0032EAF989